MKLDWSIQLGLLGPKFLPGDPCMHWCSPEEWLVTLGSSGRSLPRRPSTSRTNTVPKRTLGIRLWPSCWSENIFLRSWDRAGDGQEKARLAELSPVCSWVNSSVDRSSCFMVGFNVGRGRLESLLQHSAKNGICKDEPEFKMLCSIYSGYEEWRNM